MEEVAISEPIVSPPVMPEVISVKRKGRKPFLKNAMENMKVGDFIMAPNRDKANSYRTSGHKYFKFRFKTKKQQDGQIRIERSA